MRWLLTVVTALMLLGPLNGKPRYFHTATLRSIENKDGDELYTIDSPLGVFTFRHTRTQPMPRILKGEIRIAIQNDAVAGDPLYFLDWNGRQFKGIIVERESRPPPPAVF